MVNRLEFQEDLSAIHRDMIRLGSMAETAINKAMQALRESNAVLAHEVIQGDDAIDTLEREITQECVRLIARQQPRASDLRDITANMKLVTDLERIADHAESLSAERAASTTTAPCFANARAAASPTPEDAPVT